MNKRLLTLAVSAVVLVGSGAFVATSAHANAPAPSAPKGERHPELRKALAQLEGAMKTMREAAWDFGGHKADAMKETKNAIEELHKAMKFDKK